MPCWDHSCKSSTYGDVSAFCFSVGCENVVISTLFNRNLTLFKTPESSSIGEYKGELIILIVLLNKYRTAWNNSVRKNRRQTKIQYFYRDKPVIAGVDKFVYFYPLIG